MDLPRHGLLRTTAGAAAQQAAVKIYNILDATRNHQVFGDIEVGDWVCVMPCREDEKEPCRHGDGMDPAGGPAGLIR